MPQYVVANTVFDAAISNYMADDDIAAACCDVTLALAGSFYPHVDFDKCLDALTAAEVDGQDQTATCKALLDISTTFLHAQLPNEVDQYAATQALEYLFSSSAPGIYRVASHLLFADTRTRPLLGWGAAQFRARLRVSRKGPSQSCMLLEWGYPHQEDMQGILIGGQRFLESLLQITALANSNTHNLAKTA